MAERALHLPAELPVPSLAEARAAARCCVCDAAKGAAQPVCQSDWLALTLAQRLAIAKAETPARADEAFAVAVRFLRGLPKYRRVRVIETPTGDGGDRARSTWRLHSAEEMEATGFRQIGHGQCQAPRCLQSIVWYWTPNQKKMAVNLADYQPHVATCKDPGYAQRVKDFKSQRRRTRAAATRKRRRG